MIGKYLINTLKEKDKKKGITLITCWSRQIMVPIFFKALENLDIPREDVHLIVYDNTENPLLEKDLREALARFMCPKCYNFKSVRSTNLILKVGDLLLEWETSSFATLHFIIFGLCGGD